MKKNCELCKGLARMHCDSDQASLCWSCDFEVHAANFLLARHSRTLLCHVCQSPTQWTATGTKIGHTVSVCDDCLHNNSNHPDGSHADDDEEEEENENEIESSEIGDEEGGELEEDEDIGNGDNQVVAWSPTTPPPPASLSSNTDDEEESSSTSSSAYSSFPSSHRDRKRMRKNASDLHLRDNLCCTSSQGENVNKPPSVAVDSCGGGGGREDFVDSLSTRSLKTRRFDSGGFGFPDRVHLASLR